LSPFPTKKKEVVCLLILFFLGRSHIINVLSAAACTRKRNVVKTIALKKYRLKEKSASLHNYTVLLCLLFRKEGVKQNTLMEPCVKLKETCNNFLN